MSDRWKQFQRPMKPGQRAPLIDHPQGWTIMPIHYSMYDSSTREWEAQQRKIYQDPQSGKTDADWDQEMDINMQLVSGVRCYQGFSWERNTRELVPFDPYRPLMVCCDFNVAIKAWPVVQKIHGRFYGQREIVGIKEESAIPKMCTQLRMTYPAHPGGIVFYGDATGNQKGHGENNESYWDLIRIAMHGYGPNVSYNVPATNPRIKLRINSVNSACLGIEGEPVLVIHRDRCYYLGNDLLEVIWNPTGTDEKQTHDLEDPKHLLTHAAAGLGYMLAVERPVSDLAAAIARREKSGKKVNLRKTRPLGEM